jgi:hypothetical protein
MSQRVSSSTILFTLVLLLGLLALAFGIGWLPLPFSLGNQDRTFAQTSVTNTGNAIARENALLGTNDWEILQGKGATTQIQAYANARSVQPGGNITFYVSTQEEGTLYAVRIFRLGWYGGTGGRLLAAEANVVGHAQGYYNASNGVLANCKTCRVDTSTGLVEANWQPSYSLTIPIGWTTGIYLAKFTDAVGFETYVSFDLQSSKPSTYIIVTPDTTYEAYNIWGGYSLYAIGKATNDEDGQQEKGVKVSFNRPFADAYGASDLLSFEVNSIHWLESQGYDLSYMSNIDLHEKPMQLLQYRTYLSLNHDEYWTKEMRDGVERARDSGVGLAFLGADASYWQMRFEPDSAGHPDRTIVCYKVLTDHNDLERDPLYGKDNARVTTQWRDPLINRPENALIGIMYSSLVRSGQEVSWKVSSSTRSPLLKDTDLQAGQEYGCHIVGYEWDRVFPNGATPANLQILGETRIIDAYHQPDVSHTAYYIASSGAMVFATGSVYWTDALDAYRFYTDKGCSNQPRVVPGIQNLMKHVMGALVVRYESKGNLP